MTPPGNSGRKRPRSLLCVRIRLLLAFVTLADFMENIGQTRKLLRPSSLPGLAGLPLLRGKPCSLD